VVCKITFLKVKNYELAYIPGLYYSSKVNQGKIASKTGDLYVWVDEG
jgi:hypothetical protein